MVIADIQLLKQIIKEEIKLIFSEIETQSSYHKSDTKKLHMNLGKVKGLSKTLEIIKAMEG